MAAPAPIYRSQGNAAFRSERRTEVLKRGQTVPYDVNGSPTPTVIPPGSICISIVDLPAADPAEPLVRLRFTDDYEFAGTGASDSAIAATGASVFRIRKDGVQVGTVTFAPAGTIGTIAFSDSTFPDGSLFEIYPPATPDATLDQVSITLDLA